LEGVGGLSLPVIFFFFGGEFLQFVKNVLEKQSPKFIYFLNKKFAIFLPIV
jgi:hypothetical protein